VPSRVRSVPFVAIVCSLSIAAGGAACGLDLDGTASSLDPIDASPALDGAMLNDGTTSGTDGGQLADTSTGGDGAATDAPPPPPPPPPPIDASGCSADAGCVVVPTGWTLGAFDSTQMAPCPMGFTAGGPLNVVEGPNAPSSACSCSPCAMTTPPSCASGPVKVFFDPGGPQTCGLPGQPAQQNNLPAGACGTDLYTMPLNNLDLRYVPPPPTGGACAAPGLPQKQNVTYAAKGRLCQPDSAASGGCTGNDCKPTLPAPYRACIVGAGNQTCPSPYTATHHVGSDVSFTCAGCACNVTAICDGTMTLYTDNACQTGAKNVPVDDKCHGGENGSFNSYKYTGNPPGAVACQVGPPAAPSGVTLTGQLTVCCAL
jgi:hypothetical protein